MTKFRPCIDLHEGCVKQIVGGTLRDENSGNDAAPDDTATDEEYDGLVENFVAEKSAKWFAEMYREDGLTGGHVIKLGPGNDEAARHSLAAYPGGLQVGGGINLDNAAMWIHAGASHVIVTSWLFDGEGRFLEDRLKELAAKIGRERIVVDLSCRRTEDGWRVAMNRWQTLTELPVTSTQLESLSEHAAEFLIHAADVEGLCRGIDLDLVEMLSKWSGIPMTYAGGVAAFADVELIEQASNGTIDVTVGSALDLFGGSGVAYRDLVEWNRR